MTHLVNPFFWGFSTRIIKDITTYVLHHKHYTIFTIIAINFQEKKSKRHLFVDDEAEDTDAESVDEDDNISEAESLHLQQEDESETKEKRKPCRRRETVDSMSEDSNSQEHFLAADDPTDAIGGCGDVIATPNNVETASMAGSTISSSSSIFNTAPRWTPFKDRLPSETMAAGGLSAGIGGSNQQPSPTASQMTKKKLGFEGNN